MLNVSEALRNEGSAFGFKKELSFEPIEWFGEELTFSNAAAEGVMVGADDTVSVDSSLRVTVNAHCSRCLIPVSLDMTLPVKAVFRREADEDSYLISGHEADYTRAAFEALISELPIRFVCSTSCRGLCPVCGKNQNTDTCACSKTEQARRPLEALSVLLSKDNDKEV